MAETLGRYVLERCIAVGGMGEVHLARQTGPDGFDRQCVVKTMHPDLSTDREFVDLFLEEARLSARLSHPHIAQVYDFGKVGDTYYLAMEYVDGPSVRDVIRGCQKRKQLLNVELAARVVSQAAQALDYVHRLKGPDGAPLNLVHRDISPANLLVSREGLVKVIDFGIAKARTTIRQTELGVVRGKLAYVAPEQIASQPVDGRADIFSLGLVLYELLSLRRAVRGKSDIEIIQATREWDMEAVENARPDCPKELAAVVTHAIEKSRERRYQTAGELSEALEGVLAQLRLVVGASQLRTLAETFGTDRADEVGPLTPSSKPGKATPQTPSRPSAPSAPKRTTATAPGVPSRAQTQQSPEHSPPRGTTQPIPGHLPGASGPRPPEPARTAPEASHRAATQQHAEFVPGRGTDLEQTESHRVPPAAGSKGPGPAPGAAEDAFDDKTILALPPAAPRSSRAPLVAVGAVLAAAAVGVLGWALFSGGDEKVDPSAPQALGPGSVGPGGAGPGADVPRGAPPEPTPTAVAPLEPPGKGPGSAADAGVVVARSPAGDAPREPKSPELQPLDDDEPEPTAPGKAPVKRPPRPPPVGGLEVTSVPALEVVVDGRSAGLTPKSLRLKAGPHRVLLRSAKLGLLRDVTLRVEEGKTAKLDWRPQEGTVEVRAVPPHVELQISVDGKTVGLTPLPALKLWEGPHLLSAVNAASGWKTQVKLLVPPGGKLRVKVNDGAGVTVVDT